MARPSKLPQVRDDIIEGVRAGLTVEVAAQMVGINDATFYTWMARARGEDRDGLGDPEGIYREFHDEVLKARAQAEARDVSLIRTAARTDWRAAAWYLERSRPQRWGKTERVQVSGPDGGAIQVENVTIEAMLSSEAQIIDVAEASIDAELLRLEDGSQNGNGPDE